MSACDPSSNHIACIGLDEDKDGFFSNYPPLDTLYDANDQDNCSPNGNFATCSCPDEDGDEYIQICNNGITLSIPIFEWNARQAIGNTCGACEETLATPPAPINIDNDKDGFFANVGANELNYDPDDNDACNPSNGIGINAVIPSNPSDCQTLNDGTISINATGSNLSYSIDCLLYTSPSPRDATLSRMPSSA